MLPCKARLRSVSRYWASRFSNRLAHIWGVFCGRAHFSTCQTVDNCLITGDKGACLWRICAIVLRISLKRVGESPHIWGRPVYKDKIWKWLDPVDNCAPGQRELFRIHPQGRGGWMRGSGRRCGGKRGLHPTCRARPDLSTYPQSLLLLRIHIHINNHLESLM